MVASTTLLHIDSAATATITADNSMTLVQQDISGTIETMPAITASNSMTPARQDISGTIGTTLAITASNSLTLARHVISRTTFAKDNTTVRQRLTTRKKR